MEGRDADNRDALKRIFARDIDDSWTPFEGLDIVMVMMIMADDDQISLPLWRTQADFLIKRIQENIDFFLSAAHGFGADFKAGMAVILDDHNVFEEYYRTILARRPACVERKYFITCIFSIIVIASDYGIDHILAKSKNSSLKGGVNMKSPVSKEPKRKILKNSSLQKRKLQVRLTQALNASGPGT